MPLPIPGAEPAHPRSAGAERGPPREAAAEPGGGRRAARASAFALSIAFSAAAPSARASGYVFSTFRGDTAAEEQLSTLRSPDALNFTLVADTGFPGPNPPYLRDPSIMKYPDGKYYVAYTDPYGVGCCNPEDHFSIAVSSDLVHWSNLTTVKAGVPNASRTWAPEWFVDDGIVHVIVNIDIANVTGSFKPYVFTAQDTTLTAWSGPVPLGFGPDYIDVFVVKTGGVYHAFTKGDTYMEHATAPSLTGPWTFVGTGDWAGFGPGMEGPCVVQLDDGTWRIYMDALSRPTNARFITATSPDLYKWSAAVALPGWGGLRHGTVIRDEAISLSPIDGGAARDAGGVGPDATGDAAVRVDGGGGDATLGDASAQGSTGGSAGGESSGFDAAAGDDSAAVTTPMGDGYAGGFVPDAASAAGDGAVGADAAVRAGADAAVGRSGGASSGDGGASSIATSDGGCSCHVARRRGSRSGAASASLAVLALGWRRRRGARRAAGALVGLAVGAKRSVRRAR